MFCSKCGRPVNENALFCTFCGNPLRGANDGNPKNNEPETTAGSAPVTINGAAVGDSVPVYGGSVSASIPMPERHSDFTDSTPIYKETSSVPLNDSNTDYHEMPKNSMPMFDTQTADTVLTSPETAANPAETGSPVSVPIIDIENAPKKVEKYYTFGHIAMCLAAVAVMAIVAGVFAGLYFSVV